MNPKNKKKSTPEGALIRSNKEYTSGRKESRGGLNENRNN